MTTRRAAGSVIVASWLFCVGWAVARQVRRPPEAFLEARTTRLAPGAGFYQISLGGAPMGNAGITLDTTLAGYRLTEVWNMDVPGPGGGARHVYRSDAELSRSLRLRKLALSLSEAGAARMLEANHETDSTWSVTLRRPGVRPATLPRIVSPAAVSAPGALPFRLVLDGRLNGGATVAQPVLAMLFGTVDRDSVRVTGDSTFAVADSAAFDSTAGAWAPVAARPVRAWRVERTVHGLPSVDWVDGQGRLVRRDWAFGLRLERSPFEVNYNQYQAMLRRGELRPPARVPGTVSRLALPGRPDGAARAMSVRLARIDGPAWPGATQAFAGGRQQVRGDTVTITADQVPGPVADLVREVQARPPAERVARFLQAAALRRMTARPVVGLDLSRLELPSHTWVEVESDGGWIAVDPAFGQAPAAVSLLRVARGESEGPLVLVPLIGALRSTTLTHP